MSENPLSAEIRAAIERELAPTSIEIFDDSARHATFASPWSPRRSRVVRNLNATGWSMQPSHLSWAVASMP
jgi:hypothetical protein